MFFEDEEENVEYIKLISPEKFFEDMTEDEFVKWIKLDRYSQDNPETAAIEAVRTLLEQIERYDLLIILRNYVNQLNSYND